MKLTYRGISYDRKPNPVPPREIVLGQGTYRGVPTVFRRWAELPEQPSADLTWRGVPYRSGSPALPNALSPGKIPVVTLPVVPKPIKDVTALARNLFVRRHQRMRKREQGMMMRLGREVGISVDDAIAYGSHIQGKMPHDFSAYDRSATTMS